MKSEIPGARGTTGDGGGPPEYDPHNDSSGSDSDDSDSGPNTESLTGSDEFVRVGMSNMDESMMESGGHQDDRKNESEAHQGEDDERNIVTSKPGRGHPADGNAEDADGYAEDTDGGATASSMSHSALDQVTQNIRSLGLESGKGSSKVEESFVDGNVRGSEVGKGLIQRPNSLATIKVSEGPSSAGIAAAISGVTKVEARSEQSTGSQVPMDTIPSRPGITAFSVGQISDSSSRQSLKPVIPSSANTYNPLADSSQSSSSSNSPDACDHDKIADFSDKMKSEPNSSVVMEASLLPVSKTLNHSENHTNPSPPPATTVSAAINTSSTPEISARSENTSKSGTRTLHLSQLKLLQDRLGSISLVKTQMSSGESSPEVFSAQELPQKNHQSYMSVTGDRKLEYAGRRLSGAEDTPSRIGPEDLLKPSESGTKDTARSTSTSSIEFLNESTVAAPVVARRMTRIREKFMQKGGILHQKIKPSPSAPVTVHHVSSPNENPNTGAHVPCESSATVEPEDIQPEAMVRKSHFSTSTPPAMPAHEKIQQFKSEQHAPVQNSAPIHPSRPVESAASPPDPDQAIQIYTDGAKRHLQNLSIADIVDENESGFKLYCKAWFEAIVHERQWQQINFTMIPSETVEKVVAAYETLRSHVIRIEDIFESYICLPPAQISQQVSLQLLKGLNQMLPDFKELVESLAKQLAEHYEKRNKEIIQLEGQVIGALIQMCGKYFEEEGLHQMGSNYFESEPLSVLLKPIEQETRKHFLNVCNFKVPFWTQKYTKVFNEEIEQRASNVKSINEQRRLKTRTEIKEAIDGAVEKYSGELVEKLKKPTGALSKLRTAYRTVANKIKDDISNQINVEFIRKWKSCPLLYENAVKDFEKRVAQIYDDESKKLLDQKSSSSYDYQGATSSRVTTRSQANTHQNQNANSTHPGEKSTNLAVKPSEGPSSAHEERLRGSKQNPNVKSAQPGEKTTFAKPPQDPLSMFKDLPVSTIAIHMGLNHTSMGLFRPGTKDFVNLGRIEHMLYFRDDSMLLAYDDMTKQKLGEPDLDFRGLLVKGSIDELVEVNLGGQTLGVRKEQVFSSFLAALKWRAELETVMMFRDCVIVVPQFLNLAQRGCISDAAKIAGFVDVKLIDDTTAVALEYMMRKKISDSRVIVISALEGPIDIARFTMRYGVLRCHELSGSHFKKSERAEGFLSRARKAPWKFVSWATATQRNEIWEMFSFEDFEVGLHKVMNDTKLFVGDEELFESIKATLVNAAPKSLIKTGNLNALGGGAYMAAICTWNGSCPIFRTWTSLNTSWSWKSLNEQFEKEMLSTSDKEKKRASNFPSDQTVSLSHEDIEKITNFLKERMEVHDVAMKAVRVLKAIEDAAARKQTRNGTSLDVLFSVVGAHLSELRQPNLRIDEAKRILDDMVDTWREHVLGHGTPAVSQK